jgi:hypothetical protein
MTHNELASAIRNRVGDALSGNLNNQAYSLEQLHEEIDLTRGTFINKYINTSKLDPKFLVQEIDTLPIICRNLSEDCFIQDPAGSVPSIKIPPLSSVFGDKAIEFLGLVNMQESFAVYFSPDDIRNHKYRIKTNKRPFAWVDLASDKNGQQTIYFFNLGKFNPLKFVKLRAIFSHPSSVNSDNPNSLDMEYPAPDYMQDAILDVLTEKYIRYYRQLNVPSVPNQQNDIIT